MSQNRKKLIRVCIGNSTTVVVHRILGDSTEDTGLKKYYQKEAINALRIAETCREKINPKAEPLSEKDASIVHNKIIANVTNELKARIARGYENIRFEEIEIYVAELLKELQIL
ncbi:hypothetical protein HYY73_02580 [Candidatus Woesearchaeota archaeon]|nr:hypothetical protein [Candidatus Woesearchaeota archaeon]